MAIWHVLAPCHAVVRAFSRRACVHGQKLEVADSKNGLKLFEGLKRSPSGNHLADGSPSLLSWQA